MRAHHRGNAPADPQTAGGAGKDLEAIMKPILVFDMDGVLVDVTESYRETIARTVEHFTGVKPAAGTIQECKNQGGFNDDWKLSHHLVTSAGVDAPFEEVQDRFQSIFLGNGNDGLML